MDVRKTHLWRTLQALRQDTWARLGRVTLHEYQGKTSIGLAVDNIELQGGKRNEQTAPATSATTGGEYSDADYGSESSEDKFPF